MSDSDKDNATKDLIEDLEDQREMKALSTHNVPLGSFHDADATIQSLEKEVSFSGCAL
jgi:hypothetical protein